MIANIKRNELISGVRKAAILMVMLGEEASGADHARAVRGRSATVIPRGGPHLHHLEPRKARRYWKSSTRCAWPTITCSRAASITPRKMLMNAFGPDTARSWWTGW